MTVTRRNLGPIGIAVVLLLTCRVALSQVTLEKSSGGKTVITRSSSGSPVVSSSSSPKSPSNGSDHGHHGPPGRPSSRPGESAKPDEKKDDSSEKKDDSSEKKEGEEEKDGDETSAPTQRPTEPPEPADPEELKLRPDGDGKITFNFKGQPWPGVLQWLADVSKMSLDWQELPGGYLNLITQESYTLDEARDMINRHLLARGYTLLRHGELLSVVKLEGLNPGMVPRVDAEQLDQRDPHEIVKVSFSLDWLMADMAVEELKPMLSPHGKLTALGTTNRLEAIDVVINLREIYRLLTDEQSAGGQERLVREFQMKYTRAEEVCQQLEALLGVQSRSKAAATPGRPMSSDEMRKMQEAAARAQAAAKAAAAKGGAAPKREQSINMVVNNRKNSILVHAPPDKMAIIEQAVKAIDVPSERAQSLLANISRMQIYRLTAIDPEPLVKTLEEIGELDFNTRLEVDKTNNTIIAYATLADHVTIRALVDKLDGSGRQFEVIPLRRLPADYVATTIESMLGLDADDTQQRSGYDSYYSRYSRGQDTTKKKQRGFHVDADVENNRLLVWANETEFESVMDLLTKLGEIPGRGGNPATVRFFDPLEEDETEQLIERLRRAWPSIGNNPLVLPQGKSTERRPGDSAEAPDYSKPSAPTRGTTTGIGRPVVKFARYTQDEDANQTEQTDEEAFPPLPDSSLLAGYLPESEEAEDSTDSADEAPSLSPDAPIVAPAELPPETLPPETLPPETLPSETSPAPIIITREPDGRLRIESTDTRALDMFEDLMVDLTPRRKDYKVFQLKYAMAYWVVLNLEEYFEDEDDKKNSRSWNPYYGYGYGYNRNNSSNEKAGLSKRRPLRFISDSDTNTILVQGADPQQLKTVEDLIKIYDLPEPTDSQSVRRTQIFYLRYSQAKVVAEAIKDVYRDLLSDNDKALASSRQHEERRMYFFSDDNSEQRAPRFKGMLSIGVDELSNTLIVSAPLFLFDDVAQLIEQLDEAAEPTTPTVRAVKINPGLAADDVRRALENVLGQGSSRRSSSPRPPSGGSSSGSSRYGSQSSSNHR